MNVWYVDNASALLDLKILFMTVGKVLTNADNESNIATVKPDNPESEKY
jgi:sugar transferase EpsL